MNPRRAGAWLVGGVSGLSIWAVSLPLFGVQEPWDGSFLRYCLLVTLSGAVCELVARPRRVIDAFYWPLAFLIGEMAYMATQPDRWSLWPLALIAMVAGATPSILGVAIVRRFLKE